MAVSRMRNASGHNYGNSSIIVDFAMGQIPGSTERIPSFRNAFIAIYLYSLVTSLSLAECSWVSGHDSMMQFIICG